MSRRSIDGAPPNALVAEAVPHPPATLLLSLLTDLRQQDVCCCFWKSPLRLDAALSGLSDLDLLVARRDQHRIRQIAQARGFKLFPSRARRDDPAISSYLGYDDESGRIVHLHLYFRLMVGKSLLKDYRLPWEATLLERAVLFPGAPVRMLDPSSAALLAVVRACLELRRTDPVVLRHWAATTAKFDADLKHSASEVDRANLAARAAEVFSSDLAASIADAVCLGSVRRIPPRLRRRLRRELRPWRISGAVESAACGFGRVVLWAAGTLNDRVFHQPRPWRRRAPGGGIVVAMLGVDGSGKSTVVAATRAWLRPEIDVMPIYLGTGAGRPSLLLLPFKLMVPLATRLFATKPKGASHGNASDRAAGPVYGVLLVVWATVLGMEKRLKLVAARRGADRGLVVLADRYPQDENPAYNDGPLLPRLKWCPRWLREFEARAYALARRLPPDLVIKLDATPAIIAAREPDMDPTVIRQRVEAVRRLGFPDARVVCVDATQPLDDVLGVVRREIWNAL